MKFVFIIMTEVELQIYFNNNKKIWTHDMFLFL